MRFAVWNRHRCTAKPIICNGFRIMRETVCGCKYNQKKIIRTCDTLFLSDSNDRADAFRVKRTARNQDSHRLWQRIAGRGIRSATARIRAGPGGILLRLRSVRPVMRLAAPDGRRRPLRQAPPVGCGDIPTGPPATRPTGASGHCRANGTIGLPYGGKVGEPTAPRRQGIEA